MKKIWATVVSSAVAYALVLVWDELAYKDVVNLVHASWGEFSVILFMIMLISCIVGESVVEAPAYEIMGDAVMCLLATAIVAIAKENGFYNPSFATIDSFLNNRWWLWISTTLVATLSVMWDIRPNRFFRK